MNHRNVSIYFASNVGNSRANQEDNAILPDGSILNSELVKALSEQRCTQEKCFKNEYKNGFLAAVSDGMGGHSAGEVASAQTVKYLSENYHRIIDGAYQNEHFLINELAKLNHNVLTVSQNVPSCRGMGATLCGVVSTNGVYYGFNVGDSRLYRFFDGNLEQLSTDHTEGQRLLKLNLLTEEEYQRFPRKKNIYKFIGINSELIADVFKIDNCISGTALLLCSDGLSDVLSENEIATVLNNGECLENKGRMLINQALERNIGYGDNITLILIEF